MNKAITIVIVIIVIIASFFYLLSSSEQDQDVQKQDTDQITQSETSMTQDTNEEPSPVVTTDSGLRYQILQTGNGQEAQKGDIVSVHYVGTLEDGTKFDSSIDRGSPFQFTLGVGQVIKGWDEGVAGMKIGEKRRLLVPSALGYGVNGYPPVIPGNANLIFEVELLSIEEPNG